MSTKSLPDVSAKVVANAEQFIAEFKRADNAAKRSAGEIDKEVDKLTKNLKRKFGVADFGKDLLRGFGIGSGFAVAEKAAEMIVGYYERAAKAAQEMEASTERQLKSVQELIRLHQTDDQQLATAIKEQAQLQKQLAEATKPRTAREATYKREAGGGMIVTGYRDVPRAFTDAELKARDEITEKIKAQAVVVEQLRQKNEKAATDTAIGNAKVSASLTKLALDYDGADEALARGAGGMAEWNDEMEKQADGFREIVDPALKFTKQMEQVNFLLRMGKLNAQEAAAAIATLTREMEADRADRVDKALKDFFGPLDQQQEELDKKAKKTAEAAKDLGWAFQSAFEDAIIQGEKFSDVLQGLAQDILRIAIRSAITQPLGNMIGGWFSGLFGGGKAAGGPVQQGTSYLVGEQGPEVFTPNTAGSIVPNHKLAASGGAGGATYYIDARGADRTGLARLEAMIRQLDGSLELRAVGAVADHRRRGPAFT